jgi:hypothetical protein
MGFLMNTIRNFPCFSMMHCSNGEFGISEISISVATEHQIYVFATSAVAGKPLDIHILLDPFVAR